MTDEANGLILVVDDREVSRELVAAELEEAGFRVAKARDGEQGWSTFQRHCFDLVISDVRMPRSDGMTLLRRIRSSESHSPGVPVLLLSAYGTLSTATHAGRVGADDFFPLNDAGIEELVSRARQLLEGTAREPPEILRGRSSAIVEARNRLEALAQLSTPVLICGAPGTGRDAAARHIHRRGRHSAGSFTKVECANGRARLALRAEGIIFLDGADRMEKAEQGLWAARLRELDAMGEASPARVVASTVLHPVVLASDAACDSALWDRLTRFRVRLPSLRERGQDFEVLATAILDRVAHRLGRPGIDLAPDALVRLKRHTWCENLRELERVLESLVAASQGNRIGAEGVEAVLADLATPLSIISSERAREERETLLALYRKHGTYSGVARELGITRNAAKYRFAKHGLLPPAPGHNRTGAIG